MKKHFLKDKFQSSERLGGGSYGGFGFVDVGATLALLLKARA